SLGSCISAAVTVLSIRTTVALSSLSCWALANTARLTAGLRPDRADRLVQHRFLWRPGQRQAGKGSKRCRILEVKGELFVTQLPLLLEQRTAQHRLGSQAAPSGLAQSVATQITRHQAHQRALPIQP